MIQRNGGEKETYPKHKLHKVESVCSAPADWLAVTAVFASDWGVGYPVTVYCRLTPVDCHLVHLSLHHLQTLDTHHPRLRNVRLCQL